MRGRLLRLSLALAAVAVLAGGCRLFQPVEDTTRYYLLDAADAGIRGEEEAARDLDDGQGREAVAVGIRQVRLADYLDTPAMTVRSGGNRVRYSSRHRWGEDLDRGIARNVAASLRSRPGIGSLPPFPRPASEPVDYEIDIHVFSCEGVEGADSAGRYVFAADWKIYGNAGRSVVAAGEFRREDTWEIGNYSALAEALGAAIRELGYDLAAGLPTPGAARE